MVDNSQVRGGGGSTIRDRVRGRDVALSRVRPLDHLDLEGAKWNAGRLVGHGALLGHRPEVASIRGWVQRDAPPRGGQWSTWTIEVPPKGPLFPPLDYL